MMATIATLIIPLLMFLVWLGLLILMIWLAIRLVRAVEEIADKSGLATRMLEVMIEKIVDKSTNSHPPTES